MAYYFPMGITACLAAITIAGWPLATRIERALTSAASLLAVYTCTVIYL